MFVRLCSYNVCGDRRMSLCPAYELRSAGHRATQAELSQRTLSATSTFNKPAASALDGIAHPLGQGGQILNKSSPVSSSAPLPPSVPPMTFALLSRALCLLVLLNFFRLVVSPPPPISSPYWLEDFLAMDWREAIEFSKQMAEGGSSLPADAPAAADSVSSSFRADTPRHQPALAVQTAGPSPTEVSEQQVRAQIQSLATLAGTLHLPSTYTWRPLDQLKAEMERHVLSLDNRLEQDMSPMTPLVMGGLSRFPSSGLFKANSKAFAIQLPSGTTFVKFFTHDRFGLTNPFPSTMTIWSLNLEIVQRPSSPLALCGIWGVSTGVQAAVIESLRSVKYVVRKGSDSKFLQRDAVPSAPDQPVTLH